MTFQIIPYRSVGPIRFGMSEKELISAVGIPTATGKNSLGELDHTFDGFRVALSSNGTVCEVGMLPEVDVVLDGIHIFSAPDDFEILTEKDGDPYEYLEFVILLKFGITLTGFHDKDQSQRAVTVFERGRWDGLKKDLRKLSRSPVVPIKRA